MQIESLTQELAYLSLIVSSLTLSAQMEEQSISQLNPVQLPSNGLHFLNAMQQSPVVVVSFIVIWPIFHSVLLLFVLQSLLEHSFIQRDPADGVLML
jgi:hypothetical protein